MRINKKIIAVLIIVSGVAVAGITSIIIFFPIQESFESKIRKLITKCKIPSLAAGILVNDSLIWASGFGDQPDLDTVYMIGSITKTFTTIALLQLNESNLIQLDGDINNYLPFDVRNPNFPNKSITARMLLSHRAGLARDPNYFQIWYLDNQIIEWMNENLDTDYTYWTVRPSLEEFLNDTLTPTGLYYTPDIWYSEPGSKFYYSNLGFELLGYLVEQVSNHSMIDYIQQNILNPLNMSNNGYNYLDFGDNNAIPYEWFNNSNTELPLYNHHSIGAGSLRCTILDLANFLSALMNKGNFNGTQLLNPESIDLMREKYSSLTGSATGGLDLDGYGLGWILYVDGLLGHNGAVPGYIANMFLKESEQGTFGVIVLLNLCFSFFYDYELVNNFFPAVNNLLYEEAKRLIQ